MSKIFYGKKIDYIKTGGREKKFSDWFIKKYFLDLHRGGRSFFHYHFDNIIVRQWKTFIKLAGVKKIRKCLDRVNGAIQENILNSIVVKNLVNLFQKFLKKGLQILQNLNLKSQLKQKVKKLINGTRHLKNGKK